jgi:hypothetical protein
MHCYNQHHFYSGKCSVTQRTIGDQKPCLLTSLGRLQTTLTRAKPSIVQNKRDNIGKREHRTKVHLPANQCIIPTGVYPVLGTGSYTIEASVLDFEPPKTCLWLNLSRKLRVDTSTLLEQDLTRV